MSLHEEITAAEKRIHAWHRSSEISRRLETIPGIGPITALAATITDPSVFKSGRELAAWIGLDRTRPAARSAWVVYPSKAINICDGCSSWRRSFGMRSGEVRRTCRGLQTSSPTSRLIPSLGNKNPCQMGAVHTWLRAAVRATSLVRPLYPRVRTLDRLRPLSRDGRPLYLGQPTPPGEVGQDRV